MTEHQRLVQLADRFQQYIRNLAAAGQQLKQQQQEQQQQSRGESDVLPLATWSMLAQEVMAEPRSSASRPESAVPSLELIERCAAEAASWTPEPPRCTEDDTLNPDAPVFVPAEVKPPLAVAVELANVDTVYTYVGISDFADGFADGGIYIYIYCF